MKLIKKTSKIYKIIILVVIISTLLLIHMVQAANAVPGSEEDPVISKSFLDAEVAKLNDKINELNAKADNLVIRSDGLAARIEEGLSSGDIFEPIEIEAGKKIIAGGGTEIVLRSGKATAIAGTYGGVANLSAGVDLQTGADVTQNHLLLISRDDGRGLKAETGIWVLIKGKYTIE